MSTEISLKELYKDYFRFGVACEKTNVFHEDREIGNPEKEAVILKYFNSITFENELKPEYNMGYNHPDATETYLPFCIYPAAEYSLNWAKDNNMYVRGHVLIWHSQCPDEVFCKEYKPIYIPEYLEKGIKTIDPSCYASRDVMLKRVQSYVYSAMEYMYKHGYAKLIYAWDVANETIEPSFGLDNGMRETYWYRTIGSDYVYWVFKYTKDAINELSSKYLYMYDVDDIKEIQPELFLCEYNEWEYNRKRALINLIKTSTDTHGSILDEGLIDGIGLQGHLSDDTESTITRFVDAIKEYSEVVNNIHITEFDVKAMGTNINREYEHGIYCKKLFEQLIDLKKKGVNITSVTVWGLTDDKACFYNNNPLLFHSDLTPKLSLVGIMSALTGDTLPSPQRIEKCVDNQIIDFEHSGELNLQPSDFGCYSFGFADFRLTDSVVYNGKYSLAFENRQGLWGGVLVDVSKYKGSVITVGAWVKCDANIKLTIFESLEGTENSEKLAKNIAPTGTWTYCENTFDLRNLDGTISLVFMPMDIELDKDCPTGESIYTSSVYIDDISINVDSVLYDFNDNDDIILVRNPGSLLLHYTTSIHEGLTHDKKILCVIRSNQQSTICFRLKSTLIQNSIVTINAKTMDKVMKVGLDDINSIQFIEVESLNDSWIPIQFIVDKVSNDEYSNLYIETDGNADLFIESIKVTKL